MLNRYEIKRYSKLLAIFNFISASFIVYVLRHVIAISLNDPLTQAQSAPYVARVVANSNSVSDQQQKNEIAQTIHKDI